MDETIVVTALLKYLQENGPSHYDKFIKETSGLNADVIAYLQQLTSSQRFRFFKERPAVFKISNDGKVFLPSQILDYEPDVIKFIVGLLEALGWMHYSFLVDKTAKCFTYIKYFFENFSESEKIDFFAKHNFKIQDDGYVFLNMENRTSVPLLQVEIENKIIDHFVSVFKKQPYCMSYSNLIKTLSDSKSGCSLSVKSYFSNWSHYDQCHFFLRHSDIFVIDVDKNINLTRAKLEELSNIDALVEFLAQTLDNLGWLHYTQLLKILKGSNVLVKNHFDSLDVSEIFMFFKKRCFHFHIIPDGYVYLHGVRKRNIKLTKQSSEKEKMVEKSVIDFLVAKLRTTRQMYFQELVYSLSNASLDITNYFEDVSGYQICMFFKRHDGFFKIGLNRFVTLAKSQKKKKLEIKPVASQVQQCNKKTFKIIDLLQEHLEQKVIEIFCSELHNFKVIHFSALVKSLMESSPDAKLYCSNFTLKQWFQYFKEKSYFCIDNDGKVSSSSMLNSVIEFFISTLKNFGSMHRTHLSGMLKSKFSTEGAMYLENLPGPEKFNFFRNQSKHFVVGIDGYVSLVSTSSTSNPVVYSDNKSKVIDFLTTTLKQSSAGPLLYTKLVETFSSVDNYAMKNFFSCFTLSEEIGFFKARPSFFDINSEGLVSLPSSRNQAATSGQEAISESIKTSSTFNAAIFHDDEEENSKAIEDTVPTFENNDVDTVNMEKEEGTQWENEVISILTTRLLLSPPTHCILLAESVLNAKPEIRDHFLNNASPLWSKYFKERPEHFSIDGCNFVSLPPDSPALKKKRHVLKIIVQYVKYFNSMHYTDLVGTFLSSSNKDIVDFFSRFDVAEKKSFFKNHPSIFDVTETDHVSLTASCSDNVFTDLEKYISSCDAGTDPIASKGVKLCTLYFSSLEIQDEALKFCINFLQNSGLHYSKIIKQIPCLPPVVKKNLGELTKRQKLIFFKTYPDNFMVFNDGFVYLTDVLKKPTAMSSEETTIVNNLVTKLKNCGRLYLKWLTNWPWNTDDVTNYFDDFTTLEKHHFFPLRPFHFELKDNFICLSENVCNFKIFDGWDSIGFIIDTFCSILNHVGSIHFSVLTRHHNVREHFDHLTGYLKRYFFVVYKSVFQIKLEGYVSLIGSHSTDLEFQSKQDFSAAVSFQKNEEKVLNYLWDILKSKSGPMLYSDLIQTVSAASEDIRHFFDEFSLPEKYFFFRRNPLLFSVVDKVYIQLNPLIQSQPSRGSIKTESSICEKQRHENEPTVISNQKTPEQNDCLDQISSQHDVNSTAACNENVLDTCSVSSCSSNNNNNGISKLQCIQKLVSETNFTIATVQSLSNVFGEKIKTFSECKNDWEREEMIASLAQMHGRMKLSLENFRLIDVTELKNLDGVATDFVIMNKRNVSEVENEVCDFFVEFLNKVKCPMHYETLFFHLKHTFLYNKNSISSLCTDDIKIREFLSRRDEVDMDSRGMITVRKHSNSSSTCTDVEQQNLLSEMHVRLVRCFVGILKRKQRLYLSELWLEAKNWDPCLAEYVKTFSLNDRCIFIQIHEMYFRIGIDDLVTLKSPEISVENVLNSSKEVMKVAEAVESQALRAWTFV